MNLVFHEGRCLTNYLGRYPVVLIVLVFVFVARCLICQCQNMGLSCGVHASGPPLCCECGCQRHRGFCDGLGELGGPIAHDL
jgi:hypothetical protein